MQEHAVPSHSLHLAANVHEQASGKVKGLRGLCVHTSCQESEGLLSLVPGVHCPWQRLHLSAGNALVEVLVRLPYLPSQHRSQAQSMSANLLQRMQGPDCVTHWAEQ